MQEIKEKIILPHPKESVAIALGREKIAAICYDRVWSPSAQWRSPRQSVPDSIRFYGGTAPELAMLKALHAKEPLIDELELQNKFYLMQRNLVEIEFFRLLIECCAELREKALPEPSFDELKEIILDKFDDVERSSISSDFMDFIGSIAPICIHASIRQPDGDLINNLINKNNFDEVLKHSCGESYVQREITRSVIKAYGINTVNIYGSENTRMKEFTEGDRRVVVASLEGIGIIDETTLTWEQILDFRKDTNARHKYIRFLHWLDKDMIGRSPAYIEDEISLRLQDYERSLKNHGIKTVIGTVSEVLDGKYIIGSSSIVAGLSLSGHPVLGFLVGAGLLIGKVVIKISETALSFDDNELGINSEVSWVYEVKELSKRQ